MKKIIGTIMYFYGALVPAKDMYMPRLFGLVTFLAFFAGMIYIMYKSYN